MYYHGCGSKSWKNSLNWQHFGKRWAYRSDLLAIITKQDDSYLYPQYQIILKVYPSQSLREHACIWERCLDTKTPITTWPSSARGNFSLSECSDASMRCTPPFQVLTNTIRQIIGGPTRVQGLRGPCVQGGRQDLIHVPAWTKGPDRLMWPESCRDPQP